MKKSSSYVASKTRFKFEDSKFKSKSMQKDTEWEHKPGEICSRSANIRMVLKENMFLVRKRALGDDEMFKSLQRQNDYKT
jgi:hypothetical protein